MSFWTSATKPMYTTAISDRVITNPDSDRDASGRIGRMKRTKPYAPIFSVIAARTTEPPVGASTWASGSQVCTGHIGTFTENARKNATKSRTCADSDSGTSYQSWIAKLCDTLY